nr:helix-turn-helix domain-containing protein [Methanomicrobium sp. W14]
MKKTGMSEYEAKTYTILIALRVASAREIHEITKIPRGRVYETLSSLTEKRFIVSSPGNPARYSAIDLTKTFDRLKRETGGFFDSISSRLQTLEKERPDMVLKAYDLRTEWSIEKQIRLIFARAKCEMIILCNDPIFLERCSEDIIRTQKRIRVYTIVSDEKFAELTPGKCYIGDKDIKTSFFDLPEGVSDNGIIKLIIYADRHESLLVFENEDNLEGVYLSNDIHAVYLSKTLLKNIREIEKPKPDNSE